jgi:2-keto-4-pentenoate hydratase
MSTQAEDLAARLRAAYADGPVAPLRDGLEPNDVDGAYRIQSVNTAFWVAEGRRVVGRKIGLTAKAVQLQLGVDQPDFGVLFADMEVPDGGELAPGRLLQGRVEAEIALIMGRDLQDPHAGYATILSAAAYALPALEIVDSRIQGWKITFGDTVADNASSGAFVLGREPKSLAGLDLRSCGMVMELDGRVASLGAGAACLGHPLEAAAWLARTLALRGERLRAGDVVLTGALGPMVALTNGVQVRATIGGVGSVGFAFRADPA